jgi:putative hemolysin
LSCLVLPDRGRCQKVGWQSSHEHHITPHHTTLHHTNHKMCATIRYTMEYTHIRPKKLSKRRKSRGKFRYDCLVFVCMKGVRVKG